MVPPEDVPALAAALERLMASAEERKQLAFRAPEVLVRFSKDKALAMWEQFFDALSVARRRLVKTLKWRMRRVVRDVRKA